MSTVADLMEVVAAPLLADDLDALLAQLARRGEALAALEAAAAEATDVERDAIRDALKQVLTRDHALIAAAQQAMGGLAAELSSVKGGRDAVRGYRGAAPHGAGAILSTA